MQSRNAYPTSPSARRREKRSAPILLQAFLFGMVVASSSGMVQAASTSELADLDLDELGDIRVTSVSKRAEPLSGAPASIYVISGEDIRRSSASTLPEALRLAPNLQVARVDARNYAVTARGFNSPFENKLLVLIDGRTVYSPLFSGVYWDAQDVVLEDIARIEVISGPGATLWGSNAVNGVINIITKSAADTRGQLASVSFGKDERQGTVRQGGVTDGGINYRVYAKYIEADDPERANGSLSPTGWNRRQAGFRSDWGTAGRNVTVQGDVYSGSLHQAGTRNIEISGANLTARSNLTLDDGSVLTLQGYVDQTRRDQPGAFVERLNTIDLQGQHAMRLGRHHVVWGAGYRVGADQVQNDTAFAFLPDSFDMHWGNVFAQDEISLADSLRLTVGAKMEHNPYTGNEFLPNLRLAWNPAKDQLVWASLARAVRSPSRIDRDLYSPTTPRVVGGVPQYGLAGGPDFGSEYANVLELGYRGTPTRALSYSATAYYARYDRLRTLEPNAAGPGLVFRNMANARNVGLELWGNWQASERWRLSAGFTAQRISSSLDPGSRDSSATTGLVTSDPSNQWQLRSLFDVAPGQELDLSLRHVNSLVQPAVPSYTALDLRYGWKVRRNLEISITGQNLLDPAHPEWGAAPARSEYDRAVMVKAVWRM
ncbi:TonB-dependent receptor plug domain-containing protein [Noviherbaspirillum galbum]|uniref:TonB-dependent receptor n=1 Tax=Noviherbaspirillum galbum TaxID=2709383 RepID=A0A6B3SFC1_9BURK|nr:TonB-dependent receptor [Noviherbaspirillum galbum]NEX59544.1 TonB-dependent receptor [Noviherbaspirillum galbum]